MLFFITAGALAFVLIIVCGLSWYFSSKLMYPPHNYSLREELAKIHEDPALASLPIEELSFHTQDHLRLKAWYIGQKKEGAPGIVIAHGRGTMRSFGLPYARPLYEAGFQALFIDLRHFGESQGAFSSIGYHERHDIKAAVDLLVKEKKASSVGVFGFSMGAVAAILAMAEDHRIQAGIFEGPFMDLKSIISYHSRKDYKLASSMFSLILWLFSKRSQVPVEKLSPRSVIGSIAPRPIFIIHGMQDDFTPPLSWRGYFCKRQRKKTNLEAAKRKARGGMAELS